MYGIDNTNPSTGGLTFGLNTATLKTIAYNPNGGKAGAKQDSLDITFDISGREISYRQFPVEKAYDKDNNEVTDKNHSAFKEAVADLNIRLTQLLSCFVEPQEIDEAFSKEFGTDDVNFVQFAKWYASMFENLEDTKLHLFANYSWSLRTGQNQKYLELPKKAKYGNVFHKYLEGTWTQSEDSSGIKYVNEQGQVHPISRNKWFADSNFCKSGAPAKPAGNSNFGFGQKKAA